MTREERKAMCSEWIAAQAASGLSGQSWCEREDVSHWSFIQWRRRLGGETAGEWPLCLVRVLQPAVNAPCWRIRIGAVWIEVGAGFDAGLPRQLVEALR